MAYLPWIPDEAFKNCVADVLAKGIKGIHQAEKEHFRNGLDPFSAVFDATCQQLGLKDWTELERRRQAQKTLQNALGKFHQNLLGHVADWRIPQEGFIDLTSEKNKIVAELKNKHNTVKKSDLKFVYDELEQAVMHKTSKYVGYTGYYVTIIPDAAEKFNRPFTPSNNETKTKKSEKNSSAKLTAVRFMRW